MIKRGKPKKMNDNKLTNLFCPTLPNYSEGLYTGATHVLDETFSPFLFKCFSRSKWMNRTPIFAADPPGLNEKSRSLRLWWKWMHGKVVSITGFPVRKLIGPLSLSSLWTQQVRCREHSKDYVTWSCGQRRHGYNAIRLFEILPILRGGGGFPMVLIGGNPRQTKNYYTSFNMASG